MEFNGVQMVVERHFYFNFGVFIVDLKLFQPND